MKKTKTQKGITLVALIITIIILLILAVVAIKEVQGDGIIAYAIRAKQEQIQKQDEEEIMLAVNEWKIVSNTQKDKTFAGFMGEKFGEENIIENADKSLTITMESGNKYTVKEDGTITIVVEETPSTPDDTETPTAPDEDKTETAKEGSFTIDGRTMTALEGMTWEKWLSSSYNTMGLTTGDDEAGDEWVYTSKGTRLVCGEEGDWWNIGPSDLVLGECRTYFDYNIYLDWKQDGITVKCGGTTLNVGQTVYDEDGKEYRILDVQSGELRLVSVDYIRSYTIGGYGDSRRPSRHNWIFRL